MTQTRPPLSVRLEPGLASALDKHCDETGQSRSQIVQQSVAQYLVTHYGPTLGGLAEAVLPPLVTRSARKPRTPRQKRFRDYVREKRRR